MGVEMKRNIFASSALIVLMLFAVVGWAAAQDLKTIKLNAPNTKGGLSIMEALSLRASVREWSDKDLTFQELSDLLWAANGINRPDSKKRTAASAMNAQDVDVYVLMKDGAYLYDAAQHSLILVAAGDHRAEASMRPRGTPPAAPGAPAAPAAPAAKPEGPAGPPAGAGPGGPQTQAPVLIILVSDVSRFDRGPREMALDAKLRMAALDTGIVSQNIGLFCAGTGLATRPRAGMNTEAIKTLLKLKDTQYPLLNHPVGYPK